MKIYFTENEGELWQTANISRRRINLILKFQCHLTKEFGFRVAAMRIGKAPIVYDFILLRLGYSNWIRTKPADYFEYAARMKWES